MRVNLYIENGKIAQSLFEINPDPDAVLGWHKINARKNSQEKVFSYILHLEKYRKIQTTKQPFVGHSETGSGHVQYVYSGG